VKYPSKRINIQERISKLAFNRMMQYSDNRVFCTIIAKQIADEVVGIISNNYRRRVRWTHLQ